jgi:methionine-R-sulfoxide reductase
MTRIQQHSSESSHLIWLGLLVAAIIAGGAFYFMHTHSQKKKTAVTNYLRPVPTERQLRARLSKEQYQVMREGGTEAPFHNQYYESQRPGIYVDLITGGPLFSSTDKFDSGLGLPSFSKPISKDRIVLREDTSHDMKRIEIRSSTSDSHLGHLFNDGPPPTKERYTVNSAALHFVPRENMEQEGYREFLPIFEEKK